MTHEVLEYILWIFAVYGMFSLMSSAIESIRCRIYRSCPKVRLVLLVKNAEECIEYLIRNITRKGILSGGLLQNNITIVDMNSTDNTYFLSNKLRNCFQNVEVFQFEDREHIFEEGDIFSLPQK